MQPPANLSLPLPRLSRLGRIARKPARGAGTTGQAERCEQLEKCELCSQPLVAEHRHLLDLQAHRLLCACQACTILFDRSAAGGRHYRLIPDRCRLVGDFELPDELWARLAIPVELAFIFRSTTADRMVAFYPSPVGATESLLELDTWEEIAAANPVLGTMEPDVEALLVNHARGAREHWLVPVDECYRLVGLIRTHWRGLGGGLEVWSEIASFFDSMRRRSSDVNRNGEAAAAASATNGQRQHS
jgi:hypothetical protein